ncbi:MAG: NfeD family protein [Dehalococcoidales bacterium]|jgi:membrane protein implicated in regulation of membrane protease activity
MNGTVDIAFYDHWAWLIAIGLGLVLIILELLLGVDTGLDLVFIGTALGLGGLITVAFHSWAWTAIAAGIICIIYVIIGRRYIHQRTAVPLSKTNIDTIIGKTGTVEQDIMPEKDGLVKVGNEEWRARSDTPINRGEVITVTGVTGVTLMVKKTEREA